MNANEAPRLLKGEIDRLRDGAEMRERAIEALEEAVDRFAFGRARAVTIAPSLPRRGHSCRYDRVGMTGAAEWPPDPLPVTAMEPMPGLACPTIRPEAAKLVGFVVFGLEGEALERQVARVAEQQRLLKNFMPVFLTDAADHAVFRRRGYAFEYFSKRLYDTRAGREGIEARLRLIEKKWGLGSVFNLGAFPIASFEREHQPSTEPVTSPPPQYRRYSISSLVGRLHLGFEERVLPSLKQHIEGPYGAHDRYEAAWTLAVWLLNKPGRDAADLAYPYLKLIKHLQAERSEKVAFTVLYSECLVRIGRIEDARLECLAAWERLKSRELAFAMSNILAENVHPLGIHENRDELRLAWINKSFGNGSERHIVKRDAAQPLSIDNIDANGDSLGRDLPLISVIMPAYNSAEFIETAMRSVLNQTWHNFELIVVDDGSADQTGRIAAQLARTDPRVKLLVNRKNNGTGFVRSQALSVARGVFVTGQDADDWGHPRKIELQATHLLSHAKCVANMSEHVRAEVDLTFSRRGRPGFYIAPNFSSLMFRREAVLDSIGYWDNVRFSEDLEYLKRLETCFGAASVARLATGPMLIARLHEDSHTSSGPSGYQGFNYGARAQYIDAFHAWHAETADKREFRLEFPVLRRPFPAPLVMTRPNQARPYRLDVVIASDFRLEGGSTSSAIEEVKAQTAAGLRTGLVHIPRYEHDPTRPVSSKLRRLVDGESVHMLTFGDRVVADLAIFRWPPALATIPTYLPEIRAKAVRIVLNQTPRRRRDDAIPLYDLDAVDRNVAAVFGRAGIWAPIGPEAREGLQPQTSIEIADRDWTNVIDLGEWAERNRRPDNPTPVIGRHARDHADKWPETPEGLLSAYPSSPDIVVSVLGGANVPEAMLGHVPGNWTVHPFDAIKPYDYLSTLDVFVYYPHSMWIEAFGRTILEAMAVGVPVLLPEGFRRTFGNAALYAPIEQARQAVQRLLDDQALYDSHVRKGRAFVENTYGHQAHLRRLAEFVAKLSKRPKKVDSTVI